MMKKVMLVLLVTCQLIGAKYYKLTTRAENPGFFSQFHSVLAALDFYDSSDECDGLEVDFENRGYFYDPHYGLNYWTYFFEPIDLQKIERKTGDRQERFPGYQKVIFSGNGHYMISNERGSELINKYIKVKPHIQDKIDAIIKDNFNNKYVIGIHYRGTDKQSEATPVRYEKIVKVIRPIIEKHLDAVIFIASDDADFLDFMQKNFPEKIIATDSIRSKNQKPVHYPPNDHMYAIGENAVMDCVLLSQCSILFKMASNLSDAACKFNPELPTVDLNTDFFKLTSRTDYHPLLTLSCVISLLDAFEKGTQEDFTIDLPIHGNKYGNTKNKNWWEYFFTPLSVGDHPQKTSLPNYLKDSLELEGLFKIPKPRAHELIQKHIHLKKNIQKKIENFIHKKYKKNYILGVYHQKKNFNPLQPPVPYEWYIEYIRQRLNQLPKNTKVFVHTTDKNFLYAMQQTFGNVIFYSHPADREKQTEKDIDEHLLINCALLAHADEIVGSGSAMLETVAQFNPQVPIKTFDVFWPRRSD